MVTRPAAFRRDSSCIFLPNLWFLAILLLLVSAAQSQTLVGTITRADMQPRAVAVYEGGNKVLVTDAATQHLLIYDGASLSLLAELPMGLFCGTPLVDEAHAKAYVCAAYGSTLDNYALYTVDLTTNTAGNIIQLGTWWSPWGQLGFDPTLGHIYFASSAIDPSLGEVDVIETATGTVTKVLETGRSNLVVNPATHEVFLSASLHTWIDVIDGTTLAVSQIPCPAAEQTGLAFNPIENKLYLTTSGWNGYWIYDRDTGTSRIVGCPTGPGACNDASGLFYNAVSNRVYTDAEVDSRMTVIDGVTDQDFDLPIMGAATAVAFRYATNHVYVAGPYYSGVVDDLSSLIQLIPTNRPFAGGVVYQGIAVNQTTGRVYIINDGDLLHNVMVVQDTERLAAPVMVGSDSYLFPFLSPSHSWGDNLNSGGLLTDLVFAPGGRRLYTAGVFEWRLYEGAGDHSYIARTSLDYSLTRTGSVAPDSSRLYLTDYDADQVSVYDTSTNTLATTITVGDGPRGIAVWPDGSRLAVTNSNSGTVSFISTASNTVTQTIPVGTQPRGIAVSPSGTRVYVANSAANTVSVIDAASATVVATIPVGVTPHRLAVAPDGRRVYVGNYGGSSLSVIDTASNTVIHTVNVAPTPEGVALSPSGLEIYIVNWTASTSSNLTVVNATDFTVTSFPLPDTTFGPSYGAFAVAVADNTARIAGQVKAGAVAVSGALVRALQSGVERARTTSSTIGDYSLHNLLPGAYDVEFSASGYATQMIAARVTYPGRTTLVHPNLATTLATDPRHRTHLPRRVISASSLSFGVEGDESVQTVVVGNEGDAPLVVNQVGVSGDFEQHNTCGVPIAAGGSCTIMVTFRPIAVKASTGELVIIDNSDASPATISLVGTAEAVAHAVPVVAFPPATGPSVRPGTGTLDGNSKRMPADASRTVETSGCPMSPLSVESVVRDPKAEGVRITIRGQNFGSGATVTVNGAPSKVSVIDPTTLVAIVPSLPEGKISVLVTNDLGIGCTVEPWRNR